jgi:hypothetical protein
MKNPASLQRGRGFVFHTHTFNVSVSESSAAKVLPPLNPICILFRAVLALHSSPCLSEQRTLISRMKDRRPASPRSSFVSGSFTREVSQWDQQSPKMPPRHYCAVSTVSHSTPSERRIPVDWEPATSIATSSGIGTKSSRSW